MPVITALYAGLIGFLLMALAVNVIGKRRKARVGIGTGGDKALERAIRAHANCAEYAPLALIVIASVELLGAPALLVHALGLTLLAGRAVHAFGINRHPEPMQLRVGGMVATFAVLGVGGLAAIVLSVLRSI
jgi:hypothetical protein